MNKGYMGKVLLVNLTTGGIEERQIEDEIYEKFLSGSGLGTYMLYKHVPANADPLGPDNMLGFVSGLLTSTPSLMTGRWLAVCKSPLTGGYGDANAGGHFSPAIKKSGFDGIFFTGISKNPVYLYIDHKGAELRDASHIWGKDAIESENILIEECTNSKKPQVAVIGQGGEKCSLISGICTDHGRIAARSGVGAVMGSKKLKAVVLNGKEKVKAHNPQEMKNISLEFANKSKSANLPSVVGGGVIRMLAHMMARNGNEIGPNDAMASYAGLMKKMGTAGGTELCHITGDSPVKNWGGSRKDYPARDRRKAGNPDPLMKREYKKYACFSCPWGCGGLVSIKDINHGEFSHTHRPEYETLSAFGSLLLNNDQKAILYINELLNRAGIDTISAGGTVAFAIECYENGILTKNDTDGLELTWGNSAAIVELVKKIINREGIGDLLADGSKAAVMKIGKGSEAYAITAGGQEPGMHEPRFHPAYATQFSADPTPGRHTGGGSNYQDMFLWEKVSFAPEQIKQPKWDLAIPNEENGQKTMLTSAYKSVIDGAGSCYMAMSVGINHYKVVEMLNAATGWNFSHDDYIRIGMRIHTLKQMFSVRQGVEPKDNIMHKRMSLALKDGPTKGRTLQTEELVRYFWKSFGWDEKTGIPTSETIEEYGLNELLH
ncbi:MAG: aldehyde ferredoxin oxidoreductase family protein [Anaerolineaceae bacterium]|nr:aldehyde ferredoxin oxidoreductase family protein [Anaerolineaceae bacterium]